MRLTATPKLWTFKHDIEECGAVFQISDQKLKSMGDSLVCPNCWGELDKKAILECIDSYNRYLNAKNTISTNKHLEIYNPEHKTEISTPGSRGIIIKAESQDI
jgi:hypothetical protein